MLAVNIIQFCTDESCYVKRVLAKNELIFQVGLYQKYVNLINHNYQCFNILTYRKKFLYKPIF